MKPFNQNKKQVMDGFCPVLCSGWSTPHADPTYLYVEQEENLLIFSSLKSTLSHRSGSRIKFHSTILKKKTKTQPINEHETSELKCTDPSEAGDEESGLEVMFA